MLIFQYSSILTIDRKLLSDMRTEYSNAESKNDLGGYRKVVEMANTYLEYCRTKNSEVDKNVYFYLGMSQTKLGDQEKGGQNLHYFEAISGLAISNPDKMGKFSIPNDLLDDAVKRFSGRDGGIMQEVTEMRLDWGPVQSDGAHPVTIHSKSDDGKEAVESFNLPANLDIQVVKVQGTPIVVLYAELGSFDADSKFLFLRPNSIHSERLPAEVAFDICTPYVSATGSSSVRNAIVSEYHNDFGRQIKIPRENGP